MDRKYGGGKSGRPARPKKRRFHGNQHTQRSSEEGNTIKTTKTRPGSKSHEPPPETLREAIIQLEEPVVFTNVLRDTDGKYLWKFLDWDVTDLAEKLGDLKLPFRIGVNAKTAEPQWDFKCKEKSMTMKEFLETVKSLAQTNEWYYFDYKYIHEWFNDHPEILSSIDWQRFGFNQQGADSTLWIGSQGAHTNCHQDSYGCNLVTQIHGRKRWILFPPDSGLRLHPTRIPYEESTVYSSVNFFCPSEDEEKDILRDRVRARMVVLEPGQVLLVPNGWWHYVESIDLSISVNVWLPLATDPQSRLGEAVVKLLVNEIGKGHVSVSDQSSATSFEAVSLVQKCIEECNNEEGALLASEKKRKSMGWSAKEFVDEYYSYVSLLPIMETRELQELLSGNRNRFPDVIRKYSQEEQEAEKQDPGALSEETKTDSSYKETTNILVNALCHPDVISKVTKVLLESSHPK